MNEVLAQVFRFVGARILRRLLFVAAAGAAVPALRCSPLSAAAPVLALAVLVFVDDA
jgi:hypothetical protein